MPTALPNTQVRSRSGKRAIGFVTVVAVVVGAALSGAAGLLSWLAPSVFLSAVGQVSVDVTPAASVFAAYAGAREVAIALTLIALLVLRAWPAFVGALIVAALANFADALGALAAQRWTQLPGALVFALIYIGAAIVVREIGSAISLVHSDSMTGR
jgi:hypothetical protein